MVQLPFLAWRLGAGFPSPAEDFAHARHDLNELLIRHPLATFLFQVSGRSMEGAGILDRDIVIVDRALRPIHGNIVLAQVDNDFTVKTLHCRQGRPELVPASWR